MHRLARYVTAVVIVALLLFGCAGGERADSNEGPISIPFEISPLGGLLVQAQVNGKEARLVIDTGAGATTIDTAKLDHFLLQLQPGTKTLRGLGTSSHEGVDAVIDLLNIGGCEFKSRKIVVTDLSHVSNVGTEMEIDGVIGYDILQARAAVIDYGKQVLLLNRADQEEEVKVVIQIDKNQGIFWVINKIAGLFR